MSFGAAIAAFWNHYAEFTGTARRSEFWWAILFVALVSAGLGIIANGLGGGSGAMLPTEEPWLVSLWSLATLLPTLAVLVRRLRDAAYGWPHVFWLLVPIAGLIVLAIFCSSPSRSTRSARSAA